MRAITMRWGRATKQFEVVERPVPHILVDSNKELHGWWNGLEPSGNRECTSERLLINPYNGCSHNCIFCYSHAFGGYFGIAHAHGVIAVFRDFDRAVARQLDSLRIASCGYLSPVTDPFQPINDRYQLSERIIKVFVDRNLPIKLTTKGRMSATALTLIKRQEHAFGEVSLLTPDEDKRVRLMAGGAPTDELLRTIERLANENKFAICRIDPIIPYVTDSREELEELVRKVVEAGAGHIITSCLDIPRAMKHALGNELERRFGVQKELIDHLYIEELNGRLHAAIAYRRKLFTTMRAICDEYGITVALCMEFHSAGGGRVTGLNREFMTSRNCDGIDIPVYMRHGDGSRFEPVEGCSGNCLACHSSSNPPACGVPDLKRAGAWKLRDYRRWSTGLQRAEQTSLNAAWSASKIK